MVPDGVTMKQIYYFQAERPSEADRWEMLIGENHWVPVSTFLDEKAHVHLRHAPSGLPLIVRRIAA